MSTSTMSANVFSVLTCDVVDAIPKTVSKTVSKTVPKAVSKEETKKTKPVVVPNLQGNFPLLLFLFSGATNNEFHLYKTKISPDMKLKKSATAQDLNTRINNMSLTYPCLVWGTTIDTSELNKMLDNQYPLPEEYRRLHDLLCDDTIKSMKRQNVLILDFRRPHLKGKEYVYLQNHQQFFFGSVRESYLTQKSEVNGLKKVYSAICRAINFAELDKIILECHKFALTGADTEWISFREKHIRQFKDAASVFEMPDSKVFERFPSIEDLKKEGETVKTFKQEILEKYPMMKLVYDRKMLATEHYSTAFPSL